MQTNNILYSLDIINLIINGIFTFACVFIGIPVGIYILCKAYDAFKEYGLFKFTSKDYLFKGEGVKYLFIEILFMGIVMISGTIYILFYFKGGLLLLWIDYLKHLIFG
ncbi:hypothetical protein [Caminibacter pacificus]|uniref:Uncharacterized protein n=1 Tax=Caminibacter pacificus TaxID=1424653 RepID=A0AAJ4UXJ9_9BACT|nr:hypothetical protein [Caminibacter pacificus]ROR39545.1 hypothetical protein EDC58_1487 [Caminibacter pacificus]